MIHTGADAMVCLIENRKLKASLREANLTLIDFKRDVRVNMFENMMEYAEAVKLFIQNNFCKSCDEKMICLTNAIPCLLNFDGFLDEWRKFGFEIELPPQRRYKYVLSGGQLVRQRIP